MVNVIKTILALLVIISAMGIGVKAYAQPITPKENIPSDIPTDVKKQIGRLYSHDPVERAYGAIELSKIGERARDAVPFLIGMLDDSNPLGWSFMRGFPPTSASTSPGSEAAKALGEIKDNRAVKPLIFSLRYNDRFVRASAAEALGKIKDANAVEPLILALKDKYWDVRDSASRALVKIDKPAVEPLILALTDKDSDVRKNAAKALGEIKDPRAVEPLIATLKDNDPMVRQKAVLSLGNLNDPRTIEHLITALKDKNNEVRWAAKISLQYITGQDFEEDPTKWQEWWEKNKSK